jgi:hypothetical protein
MKLSNSSSFTERSKNNRVSCLGDRNTSKVYDSQKVIDSIQERKEIALSIASSNQKKRK